MPLVDIQLIEGVFSADQKRRMIEKVTDTMVEIEGEAMRGVTWVRVQEFASGAWGIGGKGLTTEDVKALQSSRSPLPSVTLHSPMPQRGPCPFDRISRSPGSACAGVGHARPPVTRCRQSRSAAPQRRE